MVAQAFGLGGAFFDVPNVLALFIMTLASLGGVAKGQEQITTPGKGKTPMPSDESGSGANHYCRANNIPMSWETTGQPVEIAQSAAVFTSLGTTTPELDVLNTHAAPITNLAVVLEYVDEVGRKLVTATAAGAAPGFENVLRTPFPLEQVETWKQPLDPGHTERINGFNDGVRTITCPVAGRITFAMVRYKSGSVQQYASAGWHLGALPRIVPELTSACPPVPSGVIEIPAKLRISATGDVTDIVAEQTDDQSVLAWISTQIRQWKFHPALIDGQPKDSEMDAQFVVHASSEPDINPILPESPAVLIQFFPSSRDVSHHCVEGFAHLTENDTIP